MVSKVIHYIWVGSEIPQEIQSLIDKNSRVLEGYEIKVWTELNMPRLNTFAQHAYNEKKWAFVSDYIRFYILYHEGGIYLDTDVEVMKSFDDLLSCDFFAGWDKRQEYIHSFIIGVSPRHILMESVLAYYDGIKESSYPTSPEVLTLCYGNYKKKEELNLLPSKYFSPLSEGEKATSSTFKDAYTNHLWHESWRRYVPLRRILRRIGLMKMYHSILLKIKK